MTSGWKRSMRFAVALAAVGFGSATAAEGLKRLPADYVLPQGDGSPGKVTFSHGSHVDTAKPNCVTCHPGTFKILQAGATTTGEPIKHAAMEKGRLCGSCHGKTAFNFDDCTTCHR